MVLGVLNVIQMEFVGANIILMEQNAKSAKMNIISTLIVLVQQKLFVIC